MVTREEVLRVAPVTVLEWASRAGWLRRVLPGVYVDGRSSGGGGLPTRDRAVRRRAALSWAAGRGVFSHSTALDLWGLRRQPASEPVHLSVPLGCGLRGQSGVAVHQRRDFPIGPPEVVIRGGVPVTRVERAVIESWPLLPPSDRRAPVIRAVNDRLTTPQRLRDELERTPKLTGRAELCVLLDRLAAGCRSELEIWGHDHVFTALGMPRFLRQFPVHVDGRTIYLDVYAEAARVNFELDGATTHGDPWQREIDLRRDALLATCGILVVRYAHRRLVHEPDQVRREVLAILASRAATVAQSTPP